MKTSREKSCNKQRLLSASARANAAKQTQELSLQQSGKSNLLDEVNALKSEAKDLTDAHSREVERLQERLGALEKAHDALDVALQEEEGGFEERMKGKKEAKIAMKAMKAMKVR